MNTHFIEATQCIEGGWSNHGKFMVARFTEEEWSRVCHLDQIMGMRVSLLARTNWSHNHILVLDLQTGEGAIFRQGGLASADLNKHRIWVCPMFEPFLQWLYTQDLGALPSLVELPDVPFEWGGYRRG